MARRTTVNGKNDSKPIYNLAVIDESQYHEESSLESKLSHQFQYFKEQFLDAAASLGIAVPLDIVEDKSGHIFPFLQSSGPKYVFQIMQSQIHNVHLMRCALSVLIITTTILRKRIQLPVMEPTSYLNNRLNAETQWARQALGKFSDSVTMGSCVNILISTYNPVVQELTLNLIAGLVSVSEDAIRQMLLPPNSRYHVHSDHNSNHAKILSMQLKRLHSRVNTAEGHTPRVRDLTRRGSAMVLPTASMLSSNSLEQKKPLFTSRPLTHGSAEEQGGVMGEDNSCLAHVLSVVLLQKNRHLLLGACADIILAMTRDGSPELCEICARTPTCPLPLIEGGERGAGK
ncbi:hypothetical protein EON64_07645, partial [archaeon]